MNNYCSVKMMICLVVHLNQLEFPPIDSALFCLRGGFGPQILFLVGLSGRYPESSGPPHCKDGLDCQRNVPVRPKSSSSPIMGIMPSSAEEGAEFDFFRPRTLDSRDFFDPL